MFSLEFSKRAQRQLSKMNPQVRKIVLLWLKKNVHGCDDPRARGKALQGAYSGLWRYRVGDYRVICEIRDGDLVVLALSLGHRRDMYKKSC